jgi:RNA polymerase sigma-70 factor, ECF subfamily
MMKTDDAQLIAQILAGHSESFGQLVRRHQGAVHGLAYHLAGRFDDAQDIAQEAFVVAYLELRQLRHPERFPAWLRQLTLNCGRMWLRRRRQHASFEETDGQVPNDDPSPAEEFERAEIRGQIRCALDRLADDHRLAVTLHYLGGLSYAQIASFLDVPLSTVEGRLHRARKQLKGSLLKMVEESLQEEILSPEFAEKALEEALKKAAEARRRWEKEEFVRSCRQAMEAASRLEDPKKQIDIFTMLGEASTTWMGEEEKAVDHYESALQIARTRNDGSETAHLLKEIAIARCRHGQFDQMIEPAREALDLFSQLGNRENQALMTAALDLTDMLPENWSPGKPGGYVMAAFPVKADGEGHRFLDPLSIRNYSWGCPSRCAALVHLLRPRRFLGSDLQVGATWEDHFAEQPDPLSWGIAEGDELVARSEIKSDDDSVSIPAGTFTHCLRVETHIEPIAGGRSTEFTTRAYCGRRVAWYAPGVGLVKLRHIEQNNCIHTVYLTKHQGEVTSGYFPLNPDCQWRYRWHGGSIASKELFEDVCRVVHAEDGTTWISSATRSAEQSAEEIQAHFTNLMEWEKTSGDVEGELRAFSDYTSHLKEEKQPEALIYVEGLLERIRKANYLEGEIEILWALAGELDEEEKERKIACYERLLEIGEIQNDEFLRHSAAWNLRQTREGDNPALRLQWFEESYALAQKLDDREELRSTILSLAHYHRDLRECEKAAAWFEEAAAVVREDGDNAKATDYIADAELTREMAAHPAAPHVAYVHGEGDVVEHEDGRLEEGNSARSRVDGKPFPPVPTGTPMHDLLCHVPFNGISLLSAEIGSTSSDGLNTQIAGQIQHIRLNSTLRSRSETIEVPAGRFADCALIETQAFTSAEDLQLGPDLEQIRDYYAGVKEIWYAPGVGLVRLHYQHRNGRETDIQLIAYQVADANSAYLPLTIDNRWRYRWTDSASGTEFEDALRVATHDPQKWHIAFVTCATADSS